MVAMPRVLLLGALWISGATLAFLIGARAGTTLDRVMTQSTAPGAAHLR
jgi:hypothetical protein